MLAAHGLDVPTAGRTECGGNDSSLPASVIPPADKTLGFLVGLIYASTILGCDSGLQTLFTSASCSFIDICN